MIPQEKANALVMQFYSKISGIDLKYLLPTSSLVNADDSYVKTAKQCALLAVDEIINSIPADQHWFEIKNTYWQAVKDELQS